MQQFIDSIRSALKNEDWYVALFSCLALPDICAKIEYPTSTSDNRYVTWFNRYLLDKYTYSIGSDKKTEVFLSGRDCYALRCSYLHEGSSDITTQRIHEVLTNFHFIAPPIDGSSIHCNRRNTVLQLQIDIFCNDVILAVETWFKDIECDTIKNEKIAKLLKIHSPSGNIL